MEAMNFENQLHVKIDFDKYSDIMPKSEGPHTLTGLRTNIRVGIVYMHGWAKDIGCIAFDNLMEDLATLEISRAQTWQWLHHKLKLDEGIIVTKELITTIFEEEFRNIFNEMNSEFPENDHLQLEKELREAKDKALNLYVQEDLQDFLTLTSESV